VTAMRALLRVPPCPSLFPSISRGSFRRKRYSNLLQCQRNLSPSILLTDAAAAL